MTVNRMGNTHRSGKGGFGGRRAWITGAVAVGVVATSGAVASAAMNGSEDPAKASEECLTLDRQTMKAIFESWMDQGGMFRPGAPQAGPGAPQTNPGSSNGTQDGTENGTDADAEENAAKSSKQAGTQSRAKHDKKKPAASKVSAEASTRTAGTRGGYVQPRSFWMGWTPAKVPMSQLTVGACDGTGGVPIVPPTTPPTDVPIDQPTDQPTDQPIDQPTSPTTPSQPATTPAQPDPVPTASTPVPPPPPATTPPPPATTPAPPPTTSTPVPTVTSTAS